MTRQRPADEFFLKYALNGSGIAESCLPGSLHEQCLMRRCSLAFARRVAL
jgi:hypothetical protein